jgi:HTH-type transcriptional regulator / antitoxin HigA
MKTTAMKTGTKAKASQYEALFKRFPLRPIENDETNDKAAEICDELTDRLNELTKDERDYLEVLSDLIIKYESKWDDDATTMEPAELIRYLMEHNGLSQKDLVPELGSEGRVSEFLNKKRPLSKDQALALSRRFSLRLEALLK